MILTKEQIISALQKEPLQAGSWINPNNSTLKDCPVCAVGAVLRNVLHAQNKEYTERDFTDYCNVLTPGKVIGEPASYEEEALEQIDFGNYMSALSVYFEGMVGENWETQFDHEDPEDYVVTPADREDLISFVKEYFPSEVFINL